MSQANFYVIFLVMQTNNIYRFFVLFCDGDGKPTSFIIILVDRHVSQNVHLIFFLDETFDLKFEFEFVVNNFYLKINKNWGKLLDFKKTHSASQVDENYYEGSFYKEVNSLLSAIHITSSHEIKVENNGSNDFLENLLKNN